MICDISPKEVQSIVNAVEVQWGWSVAAQARAIFSGESLQDQNPNALKLIAKNLEEEEMFEEAEEIREAIRKQEKEEEA